MSIVDCYLFIELSYASQQRHDEVHKLTNKTGVDKILKKKETKSEKRPHLAAHLLQRPLYVYSIEM